MRQRAGSRWRGYVVAGFVAAMLMLGATRRALAARHALSAADRAEIGALLQRFFEATRDGNAAGSTAALPRRAELEHIFQPAAAQFIDQYQTAVDRTVRDLHDNFAGGTWVGLDRGFATSATLEVDTCGQLARPESQCAMGPVIEWTAGGQTRHMRIARIVRVDGHWRIYQPRL